MNPKISEKILVKSECETDPKYGCSPEKRPIQEYIQKGIVNIDKPSGPTSSQVTSWVRDIFKLDKAGHSGTLDPKVTGVFPVALGKSTKIVKLLLLSGKEYVALMTLHDRILEEKLINVLNYFKGEIYQRPPLKSSVKRQLRIKKIYYINLIEMDGKNVLFSVGCEAGTYIRKLCHDIGLVLGCGAHMQELRRTRVGVFDENTITTLHDLKDAYEFYLENNDEAQLREKIQPVESVIQELKKIWIKDSAINAVCYGANLNAPGVSKLERTIESGDPVAILSLKGELVAIGKSLKTSDEIYQMDKGVVVDLERVFMEPDTYPKSW